MPYSSTCPDAPRCYAGPCPAALLHRAAKLALALLPCRAVAHVELLAEGLKSQEEVAEGVGALGLMEEAKAQVSQTGSSRLAGRQ